MKATPDIFLQFGPFVTPGEIRTSNDNTVFDTIVGANASSSTHFLPPYRVLLIIAKSFTVGVDVAGRGSALTSAVAVLDRGAPSTSIRRCPPVSFTKHRSGAVNRWRHVDSNLGGFTSARSDSRLCCSVAAQVVVGAQLLSRYAH